MPTRPHTALLLLALATGLAAVACGASVGDDGPPAKLVALSLARQTGLSGALVASAPRVMVTDAAGHPMFGVTVDFAVTAGGGTADPASAVSGEDGIVATTWRLGTAGAQTLQATAAEIPGAAVVFTAEAHDAGTYHIDLQLLTTATDAQWAAFTGAADRIGEIVVGELTPLSVTGRSCDGTSLSGTVEDLLILVRLRYIDGRGGILGQAGPCLVRSSGFPAVGIMEFDTADLASLESSGKLQATILHEMLHVVGFGTMWSSKGLLTGAGTDASAFIGPLALGAAIGYDGAPAGWTTVPVENCVGVSGSCGGGTRDSHWRETVFENELMTGWLSGASQPLSRTTAGSLADLGYEVNLDAADAFDLAAALRADAGGAAAPDGVYLGDDILQVPIEIVP